MCLSFYGPRVVILRRQRTLGLDISAGLAGFASLADAIDLVVSIQYRSVVQGGLTVAEKCLPGALRQQCLSWDPGVVVVLCGKSWDVTASARIFGSDL